MEYTNCTSKYNIYLLVILKNEFIHNNFIFNYKEELDFKNTKAREVNILLLGTTGSGKTTSINALINYMARVKFSDNRRLEIVDLKDSEQSKIQDQTLSQTDWITVYKVGLLSNRKVLYKVNIIDTPGFGDTQGKPRDEETSRQLRYLLQHTIETVDAICLVLNGTLPRLDERQRYIFDHFSQVFTEDISDRLFIWATFTNCNKPPVLSAIDAYGIKYAACFSFENRDLFRKLPLDDKKREKAGRNFLETQETFERFFNEINRKRS